MADILKTRIVHAGWSTFMIADVRLADGTVVTREIEQHGDSVAVLPYDPERGVAVLVRLFRPPVRYAGGDGDLVEAIAGVIDEGEAAEVAARREALEEAGLDLHVLEPVGCAWVTPGISTERLSLFLAPYAAGDRVAQGGGLAGENENITVLETSIADIAAMRARGELCDLKSLTLLMALELRRPELFPPR